DEAPAVALRDREEGAPLEEHLRRLVRGPQLEPARGAEPHDAALVQVERDALGAARRELARGDGGGAVVAPGPDHAERDDGGGRRGEAGERGHSTSASWPARGRAAVAAPDVHDRLAGRPLAHVRVRRDLAQEGPEPLLLAVARLVLG